MRKPKQRFQPRRQEDPNRINERIRVPKIRLVGEGREPEVLDTRVALKMAEDEGLDLVEISPNADPPVCKIMDYKKFLYNQKKKEKELKAKQSKVVIKEIRFGPNTDDHDFNFKLKNAEKFLKEGSKVKAFVFFRGRTIVFKDRGEILLLRFAQELADYGALEQMPKLEGKRMTIMINPKKGK
ncbi:MAG: translation initiation factor IF-3 [Brumimicrobium sp.]|nr:translation initiation factor IF-3 [Brumimicrobium sp.]